MGLHVSKEYCCFAIPLYQTGIYAILAETSIVAITLGALAFAAPHVTAVAVPGILPVIFGVVAILLGLAQLAGFFGVYKEKPSIFHKYTYATIGLLSLASLLAIITIGVSAARHSVALDTCVAQFIAQQQEEGTAANATVIAAGQNVTSGETICNVWIWVQVGIMVFLWIVVTLCQVYFYLLTRSYSFVQKQDHRAYSEVLTQARESYIRQSQQLDRTSLDANGFPRFVPGHGRGESRSSSLRNEVLPEGEAGPSRSAAMRHGHQQSLGEAGPLISNKGKGGHAYQPSVSSALSRGFGGGHAGNRSSTLSALPRQAGGSPEEKEEEGLQSVYAPERGRLADDAPTPTVPALGYWHGQQAAGNEGLTGSESLAYPDGAKANPMRKGERFQ